ncbi:hypothetical protein AGMMS49579_08730 [Spirochaetia bacterium]|nr:hypothetical protein AGMMS49579_08730 [Spirochaetia bacterium]
MISLKNQLVLTYALFICLAVLTLGIMINLIGTQLFSGYVRSNIQVQSEEIVNSVMDQYDPSTENFDVIILEAMGMYFVHQKVLPFRQISEPQFRWRRNRADHCRPWWQYYCGWQRRSRQYLPGIALG